MSSAGFTPGPWTASVEEKPFATRGHWYVVLDGDENGLGEFYGDDHEANVANLRLAAAAPELHEALSAAPLLPRSFDQYDRFVSEYRAFCEKRAGALAKVRGEA